MSNAGLYCSYCGQLNAPEAVFCARCGARQRPVSEGAPTGSAASPTPTPAPSQPATSPTQPSNQATYGGGDYPAPGYGPAAYGGGYGAAVATPSTYAAVPMYRGYGGFWLRVVAAIIDAIVVGIVVFPIRFILMGSAMLPGAMHGGEPNVAAVLAGSMIGILFQLGIGWIYEAGMESSKYQATLGKMALGMKVTDLNGYRISFARATGRRFAKILSGMILFIGYIMVAFTERKQGLHDMLAGTLVVKT
jgi:uncharacterized RDD family membrane protein YckC